MSRNNYLKSALYCELTLFKRINTVICIKFLMSLLLVDSFTQYCIQVNEIRVFFCHFRHILSNSYPSMFTSVIIQISIHVVNVVVKQMISVHKYTPKFMNYVKDSFDIHSNMFLDDWGRGFATRMGLGSRLSYYSDCFV